jgi:SNF2 family DNA or RNA helicase
VRDKFSYMVLSHTDLSRESGKAGDVDLAAINWGNFDLVVIDESHNFRNNVKGKNERKSRYEKLMQDIIQTGVKTKVMLLSAKLASWIGKAHCEEMPAGIAREQISAQRA